MAGRDMHDTTRIEGFSDAVFGFAVTLLVVSLEVPGSFDDMRAALRMLPAFAASFALLLLVWQEHRAFFKRFGVDDGPLLWLNGALLFVVLAYVYPLKFLMNLLLGPDGFFSGGIPQGVREEDVPSLMVMYGLGFVLLFAVLAAMHWRALTVHRAAGADAAVLRDLRVRGGASLVYVAIGLASVLVAAVGRTPVAMGVSGGLYALTGPAHLLYHRIIARRQTPRPAAMVVTPDDDGHVGE
jgi:uncharacterized membrane protein